MLRHVAVFSWTPETTEEQRVHVRRALAQLPAQISAIRAYTFGEDAGLAGPNAQFAVVADFDDADGWRTYTDHPAHRRVMTEAILPILASRVAIQFEV